MVTTVTCLCDPLVQPNFIVQSSWGIDRFTMGRRNGRHNDRWRHRYIVNITRQTKRQIEQMDGQVDRQTNKQMDQYELLKTACVVN